MLLTDLFFNEAKSIFIAILLIFILKGDTIMVIIRNGKEIELNKDNEYAKKILMRNMPERYISGLFNVVIRDTNHER